MAVGFPTIEMMPKWPPKRLPETKFSSLSIEKFESGSCFSSSLRGMFRALLALRSERAQIVVSGERRSSCQANDDRRSVERLFEGCLKRGSKKRGKTSSRGDDRGRVPHSGMVVSGSRGFGVFLRGAGINESVLVIERRERTRKASRIWNDHGLHGLNGYGL